MEDNNMAFKLLEKYIMNPLGKLSQKKVIRAIMGAGVATIPFTVVGSMFLVLTVLPETMPFLQGFFNATFFKITELYMLTNMATMGILALYFNVSLGYEYTRIIAEEEDLDMSGLNGALLSVFAFFMVIPRMIIIEGVVASVTEITDEVIIINGWEMGAQGAVRLGTSGIFTGIIMAILAVNLYKLSVKKEWIIKLPGEVPLGVVRAFTALIPAFVVAFAVLIINGILIVLNTDVFQIVQVPFGFVSNLTNSWLGIMVIYFLIHAMWLIGIHGTNIIVNILMPITLANLVANAAGANYALAGGFAGAYVVIGGSGGTLLLTFFIAYRAKSQQLRVIGKASMIPAIFNINEPLIFGLPIIYNPFLAITFILAPMVSASIAYFAITLEWIRPMIAVLPWPSPIGVGAFIGTGGDWRAVIVAFISAIAAFIVYYPFITAYDQKLYLEEQENKE